MENKRGEITTAQIVMIIVLIVSFIVILFFFFRLNLGATTNSEICHNSIVLKARTGGVSGNLKCETLYTCIADGGICESINPTDTVSVDSSNKEEIMNAIAEKMADCWWMFGEGKLDYLGVSTDNICGICSINSFDEKVRSNSITYSEFYDYLASTQKDNTQTYLTYLYGLYNTEAVYELYPFLIEKGNENILAEDKYAILTGESKTIFSLNRQKYLHSSLVPITEIQELFGDECKTFITEA